MFAKIRLINGHKNLFADTGKHRGNSALGQASDFQLVSEAEVPSVGCVHLL